MLHVYVSNACLHGIHDQCDVACRYCGAPCCCDHHFLHEKENCHV